MLDSLQTLIFQNKGRFEARESALLAQVLQQGAEAHEFDLQDPVCVAQSMIVATNSLLPYSRRPKEIGERDEVERIAHQLIDLLLRAVQKSNPT